jgi:hypothetical protein
MPKSGNRFSGKIMPSLMRTDHQAVIPGRAARAKAESDRKDKARGRIPDPVCGHPGTTLQAIRFKIMPKPEIIGGNKIAPD